MKLCIPTKDAAAAAAEVHDHFGSATYFTIVDTETGTLESVPNDNAHHAHGTCHPLAQLSGQGIDALVVRGIGRRALDGLKAAGLTVYRHPGRTVAEILEAHAAGALPEMEAAHACGGHAHGSRSHCGH